MIQIYKVFGTILASLLFFVIFAIPVTAQVVINEINPWDEWVELYNITPDEVSLEGCVLTMGNESQKITFSASDKISGTGELKYKVIEKGTYNWGGNWLNNSEAENITLNCSWGNAALAYGGSGNVCLPGSGESVGRVPDANQTIERFKTPTKGTNNNNPELDVCPTPATEAPSVTEAPTTSAPTASPALTKTLTPTKKITARPTQTAEEVANEGDLILGLRNELGTPTPSATVADENKKKVPLTAIGLILCGVGVLGFSIFAFLKRVREDNNTTNE